MLINIEVLSYIVIACIVLTVQGIETHSLHKISGSYHRKLNQEINEIKKYSTNRRVILHHKINPLVTRLIDIENESSQLTSNHHHHHHHPLRKRHDNSGITTEIMNNNIIAALESSRNKRYESFEAQAKEVENNSLCNYTVTSFADADDYILPKNLINITCNYSGSRCQANGYYCCLQTYTHIQVTLKKGGTRPMRINTGCVCALQLFNQLKHDATQPDLNA